MGKLTFNLKYFILTVILFLVEVYIAIYVRDQFIRPFFGDFLVVILLYCFGKSFMKIEVIPLGIAVLLFSYLIEFLQYLKIVEILGLEGNTIARVVIGTTFQWGDILAYTLGILFVVIVEKITARKKELTI